MGCESYYVMHNKNVYILWRHSYKIELSALVDKRLTEIEFGASLWRLNNDAWISIKTFFSVLHCSWLLFLLLKSLWNVFLAKTCWQCKTVDNITFELEICSDLLLLFSTRGWFWWCKKNFQKYLIYKTYPTLNGIICIYYKIYQGFYFLDINNKTCFWKTLFSHRHKKRRVR